LAKTLPAIIWRRGFQTERLDQTNSLIILLILLNYTSQKTSGLSATLMELSGASSIVYYLSETLDMGSSSSYSNETCNLPQGEPCYYILNSVGICNTPKQVWYLVVQNTGENDAVYSFDVVVNDGAGIFFGCQFGLMVLGAFVTTMIGIGICACCCTGIVVAACVCSSRKRRHVHCPEKGYNRLQPTVTAINYGTTSTMTYPAPPPYRLPVTQDIVYYTVPVQQQPNYPFANVNTAPSAPNAGQIYPTLYPQQQQEQHLDFQQK